MPANAPESMDAVTCALSDIQLAAQLVVAAHDASIKQSQQTMVSYLGRQLGESVGVALSASEQLGDYAISMHSGLPTQVTQEAACNLWTIIRQWLREAKSVADLLPVAANAVTQTGGDLFTVPLEPMSTYLHKRICEHIEVASARLLMAATQSHLPIRSL